MKYIKIALCVSLLLTVFGETFAQKDYSLVRKATDQRALDSLYLAIKSQEDANMEAALRAAQINGWSTTNLVGLKPNGQPIYHKITNNEAAAFTQTIIARTTLGVTGAGMTIGLWEATDSDGNSWRPRNTHQDFGSRISMGEIDIGFGSHSTHVAGTLIGNPPASAGDDSKGMATAASIVAYSAGSHVSEMTSQSSGADPILISNHSYGTSNGYNLEESTNTGLPFFYPFQRWTWHGGTSNFNENGDDPSFGQYPATARDIDAVCAAAPYYLPCFASGNDHNDYPDGTDIFAKDEVRNGSSGTYVTYDPDMHPPGDGEQVSSVGTYANATNVLTIGNMTKTLGINTSSSRGPTDEGRIKPDLCGIGTSVWSADNDANDDYISKTGTSMAAPNVAGSLLILQDGYEKINGEQGRFMKSATLKGLALHTATDYGNPGPDYTYGWGFFNAFAAAQIIENDAWKFGISSKIMIEDTLHSANETYTFQVVADGLEELKATLCYTDPAMPISNSASLQNDLDMLIVDGTDFIAYQPYILDPNFPTVNAGRGDNDIDNIEQVVLTDAEAVAGRVYTINVTVEGALFQNNPQPFSIILSGLDATCHAEIIHKTVDLPSGTYNAKTDIFSQADIESGQNVVYSRGGGVTLKPGFHAKTDSRFETVKAVCN